MFVISYILLWILVVLQCFLLLVLIRQHFTIRTDRQHPADLSRQEIPAGDAAPQFQAIECPSGREFESATCVGSRTLLLFLSSSCSSCKLVARALEKVAPPIPNSLLVYCTGSHRGCRSSYGTLAKSVRVLAKRQKDVVSEFGLIQLPAAVLVDETWRIIHYDYLRSSDQCDAWIDNVVRDLAQAALNPNGPKPIRQIQGGI